MNGVKDKFTSDAVQEFLSRANADILIITKTHFKVRAKCPSGYFLLAKSRTIYKPKSKGRGGVAVYKKNDSVFDLEMISVDFYDIVLFKVSNTDFTFAATYIPPINSDYFSIDCFDTLNLICEQFVNNSSFFIIGDLNARTGTLPRKNNINYTPNPDITCNSHGQHVREILQNHRLTVVNGCITDHLVGDSDFTFFKGDSKSQIDLVICNNTQSVQSFNILDKLIFSDHCPISLTLGININPPLSIVRECNRHVFNHDYLDVNKRLTRPINTSRLDPVLLIRNLEIMCHEISPTPSTDTEKLATDLACGIYKACKNSITKNRQILVEANENCTSKNMRAVCDAHMFLYKCKLRTNAPPAEIAAVATQWWQYNQLTVEMEKKEFNVTVNRKWAHCSKNDTRKMWKMIDWKGQSQKEPPRTIEPEAVSKYFKGVFQSSVTAKHPTVTDIQDKLNSYNVVHPLLDRPINRMEVDTVLRDVGKGIGCDGIPPSISILFPESLRNVLLELMEQIFTNHIYPLEWAYQLLISLEKKGHTISSPQLRGICLSSLLPRIYDTIIDNRFKAWYVPNKEQSGFRLLQGCLVQLFYVILLLEMSHHFKKKLYIILVDYAKAFDYANRALLLQDMMENNVGEKFVKAVAAMYRESVYIPQNNDMLGDPISTHYGVTQGRRSSTSFFSFLLKDMPESIPSSNPPDFMDPFNLAQMADDTTLNGESLSSVGKKFDGLHDFSDEKCQSINLDKTLYIHMDKSPDTTPIVTPKQRVIKSLSVDEIGCYLGLYVPHTDQRIEIVQTNLNKRMFNIGKYKAWLDVNENTPFPIKLLVLDNCALSAILYSCEVWGDLSRLHKRLGKIELNLLKAALGVKQGTPNNLVYHELKRGSIASRIKDLQANFIDRVEKLDERECLAKCVWSLCKQLELEYVKYYQELSTDNYKSDIRQRTTTLQESNKTMDVRYRDLIGLHRNHILYDNYTADCSRKLITRWRLSNTKLAIETGRYTKKDRRDRLCKTCLVVEDEEHALFHCTNYTHIRTEHQTHFTKNNTVTLFLNPQTTEDIYEAAQIIKKIEEQHKKYS